MTEEKPKEEIKERYYLQEVPTQTALVIKDTENEEAMYSGEGILLEILNKINKIEKAVA